MMYLLPRCDVNWNAPVWSVWMELEKSSMRKKASWVLVIGMSLKCEFSPSIFILTCLFSMIFSNAVCFVERIS